MPPSPSAAKSGKARPAPAEARVPAIEIRPVQRADLDQVIALDASVTGLAKRPYWLSVYRRYGSAASGNQHFLVALSGPQVIGFIIGEVRDWEFGSPPCGWVFAIDVLPQARLAGVGTRLLAEISARFARAGVSKLRTLLARENTLILSFFRSQGMMAGPLISLEMDLEAAADAGAAASGAKR
jgi:ribosomal protein S18 acetylase RimI-like enzyme